MPSGGRLLVLTRESSTMASTAIAGWRTAGARVELVTSTEPRRLLAALDAEDWDGIALWSPDALLQHALARSLGTQRKPVVLLFEGEEGLTSGAHLDAAFFEEPVPIAPPPAEWDLALRRLLADPRVRSVFRTKWHAAALARRLGLSSMPRASVIAPGVAGPMTAPKGPTRVLFPGIVEGARRHGADLFVRAVIELSHRHRFDELEFVVIKDQVRDERVLQPLAQIPLRRLATAEALATSTLALITTRDGSRLGAVLQSAVRGIAPVALAHPALKDFLPLSAQVTDDPAAVAEAARALLDHPVRLGTFARSLAKSAQASADPSAASAAELKAFAVAPRARVRMKKGLPVLTVAVPSWNATKWLERCVGSIVRGDPSGAVDVVIVDDGSTDETGALAQRLAAADPQAVRVVKQENRGHGGAINTALREARGTFFRVVDADDWVDSVALGELVAALRRETADLVLTGYANDRPEDPLSNPVNILGRLPAGAVTRFETVLDPLYGLTSWGPLLSTSTFRTTLLRKANLALTEHSAYVDLEYCTLGLEFVETIRHLPLDLYRYSLSLEGQSVSPESYRKRFRQHEAVIMRLCAFVRDGGLPAIKRRYIAERVIAPVVEAHLEILLVLVGDQREARAFRRRMSAFDFVPMPREPAMRQLAARAARAALPGPLADALAATRGRSPITLAREVGRYVLPSALSRFFVR